MALNLTPLENAIARLEEMLARYHREATDPAVRDSVIKRFEFTYEMSAKLLKLALQAASASPVSRMGWTLAEQGEAHRSLGIRNRKR